MFRSLVIVTALLAAPAAFAEGHVHGGSDADSKVPAHQNHPVDPQVERPTGQPVELTIPGGAASKAYVARPATAARGAILVIHEWWGLNDHIKHEADLLAKQGYLALAIDLYDGKVATTPAEAGKYMGAMDQKRASAIESAALGWLSANAKGQKIATIGWCFGGGQSLEASLGAAAAGTPVAATVIYYGMPVDDVARLRKLKGPVLGIWAKEDGWITPEKVAAFDKALTDAGVAHQFHSFDADHAFANPTGGKYNLPAAKVADSLRDAFLAKNLR